MKNLAVNFNVVKNWWSKKPNQEMTSQIWSVGILGAITFFLVTLLMHSEFSFVHPDVYGYHDSTIGTGTFAQRIENLNILVHVEPARPRWVNYFLTLIDIQVRDVLVYYVIPHTAFSIVWVFTFLLGPILLYKGLKLFAINSTIALACLIIYFTSMGFLSQMGFHFMAGKYLSLFLLMAAFYFGASLRNKAISTEQTISNLYIDKYFWLLLIVNTISLFSDEIGVFAFCMLPILFWELFIPTDYRPILARVQNTLYNIAILMAPLIIFFAISPLINPLFWQELTHSGGVGTDLGFHESFWKSAVGWLDLIYRNFMCFFGGVLSPDSLSPYLSKSSGPDLYEQETNIPKIMLMVGFFSLTFVLAFRNRSTFFFRILVLVIAFILVQTFINSYHKRVVGGYYYGSSFSLVLTLMFAAIGQAVISERYKWARICLPRKLPELHHLE